MVERMDGGSKQLLPANDGEVEQLLHFHTTLQGGHADSEKKRETVERRNGVWLCKSGESENVTWRLQDIVEVKDDRNEHERRSEYLWSYYCIDE